MDLITNLQGRLKNTALPQSNGLLPVFESISNAIHAIEDAGLAMTRGSITLEVIRSSQDSFDYEQEPESRVSAPIVGFKIVDNGIGFNEDNMKSFLTLDSQYKAPRGGRGVGRLLWLKAFSRARIRTTFLENGETPKLSRIHGDSLHDGVAKPESKVIADEGTGTCVSLESFNESYRVQSPKTTRVVANTLLAHCLW